MIHFERLQTTHFALIHEWFNKPHVQAFYSLREWTLDEVERKMNPYLDGPVKGFIIHYNKPIGYIQYYPIKQYPWKNQTLEDAIINRAAGLDLFIGEEDFLHKGLGKKIVLAFLETVIWNEYDYCLVDPECKNRPSLHLFASCGFLPYQEIESVNALNEKVYLKLMIKKKP